MENRALCVSHLSDSTSEADLWDVFGTFGPIPRLHRVKQSSRAIAFVTFINHSDTIQVMESLNRSGLDNVILHVDWARPKATDTRTIQRTGYGKPLPQSARYH